MLGDYLMSQKEKKKAKSAFEVAELARSFSEEAMLKLVDLMRCNKRELAFKASMAILDRGLGKPVNIVHTLSDVSDDALTKEARRRLEAEEMMENVIQANFK